MTCSTDKLYFPGLTSFNIKKPSSSEIVPSTSVLSEDLNNFIVAYFTGKLFDSSVISPLNDPSFIDS